MLPPELVELIVRYGWNCLSTSSHRHEYSMTSWMLVSREWLSIVVPIFLSDVWATSSSLIFHLISSCRTPSFAYKLAGITDLKQYLAQNCRSLTVSIYQRRKREYDLQCAELAEYVADPAHERICTIVWDHRYREPYYGIPLNRLSQVIHDWFPNITSLHFVLVDCLPTYWYWNMEYDVHAMVREVRKAWSIGWIGYREPFTEVYFTFAYTSPPPLMSVGASRGTFYPPRSSSDLPLNFPDFSTVKKLVVREANADFIAFLVTHCPRLECIESTAEFRVDDLPPEVAAKVGDRLVFRRLAPTTEWASLAAISRLLVPKRMIPLPSKRKCYSSPQRGRFSHPEGGRYSRLEGRRASSPEYSRSSCHKDGRSLRGERYSPSCSEGRCSSCPEDGPSSCLDGGFSFYPQGTRSSLPKRGRAVLTRRNQEEEFIILAMAYRTAFV